MMDTLVLMMEALAPTMMVLMPMIKDVGADDKGDGVVNKGIDAANCGDE